MCEKPVTILSTRPLEPELIAQAHNSKVNIDVLSFIETEPVKNTSLEKLVSEIVSTPSTVIITSMNAAEAVAAYLNGSSPQWKIFCLGTATKKIIEHQFSKSEIVGDADNASALADVVINSGAKQATFFCGDLRREELPKKLVEHGIELQEIVVYHTMNTGAKVDKEYDGILFFSPSAVESFFSLNTIQTNTVLFAIGTTTAASIKQYSNNTVIESDRPGKQYLVQKSIDYFAKIIQINEHIKK